jgi:beta-phosphoglucomutase
MTKETNRHLKARPELRAVIFDAEGVVIDTEAAWDKAQKEFLSRRGIIYDRAKVKPLLSGRSLAEGTVIMQDLYRFKGDVNSQIEERRELVREFVSRQTRFVDGVESFLTTIRNEYEVALATAMDPELFAIADRMLELTKLFKGNVVTLRDVEYRAKPSPDLFLCAASRLGVSPEQCAVIEDAPLGIEAALNANMYVIGLATTYDPRLLQTADLVCNSFNEISAAFALPARTSHH